MSLVSTAVALNVSPSTCVRACTIAASPTSLSCVMLAKRTTWSIGKPRKKPSRKKSEAELPVAKGFGKAPSIATHASIDICSSSLDSTQINGIAEPPGKQQLAEVAASVVDWKSYAAAALEQVAQLEREAALKGCEPQDILDGRC